MPRLVDDRRAPVRRMGLALLLLIEAIGAGGFVGLLIVGRDGSAEANAYRWVALIWFAVFGAIYVLVHARLRTRR